MSNSTSFDLNACIRESKETVKTPKSYFAALKTSGGIGEPVIKALIYSVVAGVIVFLWGVIGLGGQSGVFGAGIGGMALVWTIIGAMAGLFIGAVILLVISAVCKGNTDFEACLRVTASVMVILPISALLGFTSGISLWLGAIVGLFVNLFALFLLFYGLTETLKANHGTTRIVMYILAVILVFAMISGIRAQKKLNNYLDDMSKIERIDLVRDKNSEA
ncbi:MAG: Yip1 family protein [Bacteroidales bacterium]